MSGKQTPPTPRAHAPYHGESEPRDALDSNADAVAAEETRRSGRANKGQHTKNHDPLEDAPMARPKEQPKAGKKGQTKAKADSAPSRSTQSAEQDEEEEEEAIIRCVCGDQRDIRGRQMICCDRCEAWQHNKCLGLPEGDHWEDKTYFCEQCKPEDHQDLLAAMARGEKPWARKKGSKPKTRPSDIKPETPQPPQAPARVATPPQASPAPVQAATPTPVPVPVQSIETSDGPTDTKVRPRSSSSCDLPNLSQEIKSQPQSPLGEKRRHEASAEKANANKKRRKSSQHQEKAASQGAPATDIEGLPLSSKPFAEKLRDTFTPLINTASDARGFRIPDGETARSLASRFALQISLAAVSHYGEITSSDSPATARMRTIMFNVRRNAVLIDRLLSGSLNSQELVTMPTEEMASEDKQREFAVMREAAEKQMILTEEAGPRMRKTHKGEELVGEDDNVSHEFQQPELRDRDDAADDVPMQSPAVSRPPESPADATRAPLAVDIATPTDSVRRQSTNFDINSVYSNVRSPQADQQAFLQRRQSSMMTQEKAHAPVEDADIDRLLKDDDNDVEMTGHSSDPTVCWQGSISMQSVESFDAVARFVAGGDFGQIVPWDKLISNTLSIQGRIESTKGDDYIRDIGTNSDNYDVAILAVSPVTSEGRAIMDHFYTYFQSRGRWGVVPSEHFGSDVMKDMYVIPIEAGGSNLPPFIDMLEHCTIETPRKEHMVLLALVAKLPDVKPQQPPTEFFERYPPQEIAAGQVAQPSNAPQASNIPHMPSPSPVNNPHGPQYSPMASNFPGQYSNPYGQPTPANALQPVAPMAQMAPMAPMAQMTNAPPHHQIPKALEILGPHIDDPVIAQILIDSLSKNQVVSEVQMANLRHVVNENPEARTNFSVFVEHIRQKTEAQTNGQQQHQHQPMGTV
jgi:hypothetical protein